MRGDAYRRVKKCFFIFFYFFLFLLFFKKKIKTNPSIALVLCIHLCLNLMNIDLYSRLFLIFLLFLQLAVLAGDFLLSRACVALASLKNTEVGLHYVLFSIQGWS